MFRITVLRRFYARSTVNDSTSVLRRSTSGLITSTVTLLQVRHRLDHRDVYYVHLLCRFDILGSDLLALLVLSFLLCIDSVDLRVDLVLERFPTIFLYFLDRDLVPNASVIRVGNQGFGIIALCRFAVSNDHVSLPRSFVNEDFRQVFLRNTRVLINVGMSFTFLHLRVGIRNSVFRLVNDRVASVLLLRSEVVL